MFNGRSSARLAGAVLDGESIDWTRVNAGADAASRPLVENLQAIDRIARTSRAGQDPVAREPAVDRVFWKSVAALSAFQLAVAAAGYFRGVGATASPSPPGPAAATAAAFTCAAIWLLARGRGDRRARWLALFFLVAGSAFSRRFLMPLGAASALLRGVYPETFLALFLWRFVRDFPRVVRFSAADRFCRLAERASLAAGLLLFAANVALQLDPRLVPAVLQRSHPRSAYWATLAVLALPAIPVAWLRARAASPHERRRLAFFTLGLAAGILPPLLEILAELAIPSFARFMAAPGVRRALAPVFFIPLLLVPFITAYSVIVDRVLDGRLVIGRALQYLLMRTTILMITLLPFALLGWQAYQNRDVTLAILLSSTRGTLLAAMAATGAVLWLLRGPALAAIDRRFFRTGIDASGELSRLSAAIRNARSVAELADLVESGVTRALQIDRATLLVLDPARQAFVPHRAGCPALTVASAIGALTLADAAPLSAAPGAPRSCFRLVPASDRQWIEASGAALIVPLVGSHDSRVGLLVLGAKRSELPFARDDEAFAATVASAAALVLEARARADTPVARDIDAEPASECPACGLVDGPGVAACACGAPRRTASLPATLAGKFRVERTLGAGGMGVVYRAVDLTLDRTVALKTLPRLSGRAAEQLRREARLMATVVHPNLATIFGVERWRDTPVLVVEYLEGGTLANRMAGGPLPAAQTIRLGVTLAAALEELHRHGILHRDIKPGNIAFSAAGVPKLLDFGLATLLAEGDELAGTPLYLSPEAIRGAAPAPDLDVWSLSLVLYEAIAGVHPFAGATLEDVLRNVRRGRVPPIRDLRGDCPLPLAGAFAAILSEDRGQRPATATELRQTLEQLDVS